MFGRLGGGHQPCNVRLSPTCHDDISLPINIKSKAEMYLRKVDIVEAAFQVSVQAK
jgi:hypothetical protein